MAICCSTRFLEEKLNKLARRSYNAKKFVESVSNEGEASIKSLHKTICIYEELLEAEIQLKSAINHLESNLDEDIIERYSRGE